MNEFLHELIKGSFLVALQIENGEDEFKSHTMGFKRESFEGEKSFYVFPTYEVKNGKNFSKFIRKLYRTKRFDSLAIANVSNELYCRVFNMSEEDYRWFIKENSHEICVEEEFGWFEYFNPTYGVNGKYIYYRIPKELVLGTIKYSEDIDETFFIPNENYYANLTEEDKEKFIKRYKRLIRNEIENEDYDQEYPCKDIISLTRRKR